MKIISTLVLGILVLAASSKAASGRLDQTLQMAADRSATTDSLVRVVVFLENESSRYQLLMAASDQQMSHDNRLKVVTSQLRQDMPTPSNAVVQFLSQHSVTKVGRHWIVPSISAEIPSSLLNTLAAMPGVDQVIQDIPLELVTPVSSSAAPAEGTVASELKFLGVPSLWQRGITGKGRLVCSFDTGVDGAHPALASKWRGNHAPLSASFLSFVHPDTTPYDNAGHGTHTMGIMCGSNGIDSFGVAPGAEWINAAVIDQGPDLQTTISDILMAFEWALNPDGDTTTTNDVPDVILNSWGLPTLQPSAIAPCSTIFWQAIDNVEAAGIVTIFAAGNEGRSGSYTIRNPANRASTPLNSFCVGAIGLDGKIADFSSRGPSSCDSTQIKPEVVAPGISIRSSYKGGGYVYMSGTSMAAPYIAGMVALCRQYNPDATVEQIKEAFIHAAADLGNPGEDNDYGWGYVDASKLPQYLPAPRTVDFTVANQTVLGSGIAVPGTQISLQLTVTNSTATVDRVTGTVSVGSSLTASMVRNQADFVFGVGGTTAVSSLPYLIQLSPSLTNGSSIPLQITFVSSTGVVMDSVSFNLSIGYIAPGTVAALSTGRLSLNVSDFGQYGFAPGSIYNLGTTGCTFENSGNLLYEAGLLVGRNSLQMASGIRDTLGQFAPSAFRPTALQSLSSVVTDAGGGVHHYTSMTDAAASIQIPVTIRQETIDYTTVGDDNFVILSYQMVNQTLEKQTGLHFGFLADFDLSDGNDRIQYSAADQLVYQHSASGTWIGLAVLSGSVHFTSLANGATKRGLSSAERVSLLTGTTTSIDSVTTGDLMLFANSDAITLPVGDSSHIALALVAGASLADLAEAAARARQKYDLPTSVDDRPLLPTEYNLGQNYPNPFNPTTTISFSLARAARVDLVVYNSLGQVVRTLISGLTASGEHQISWDGQNDAGLSAATGVYFYRLTANGSSQSRKMMLLK